MKLNHLGWIIIGLFSFGCSHSGDPLNIFASKISSSQKSPTTTSQNEGGNGNQYDGKLETGRYVRQLTKDEELCGSKLKNLGEIIVSHTHAMGYLLNSQTCQETVVKFQLQDLEHSLFQKGRVGFNEGIYSLAKGSSGESVKGLDEVWCRKEGSTTATGFDIVIKADYATQNFTALTASAKADDSGKIAEEVYNPYKVSRRFEEGDRVRYRADGFDLEIRRRDYNSQTGLMQGELSFERNGIMEEIRINCRLGGELDILIPKK